MKTCPCGFTALGLLDPNSVEWHKAHKEHHLAAFPGTAAQSAEHLDFLVRLAERGAFVRPGPVVS